MELHLYYHGALKHEKIRSETYLHVGLQEILPQDSIIRLSRGSPLSVSNGQQPTGTPQILHQMLYGRCWPVWLLFATPDGCIERHY